MGGGGVPGSGVGEMAKRRGERVEGVLVVPMRARDRALGLYPELSTVTARWRPCGWPGWCGEGRGLQRKGRWVQGFAEVPREAVGDAGGGLRPPTAAAAPLCAGGRKKQRSRDVGDEVWTDLQFPKSLVALM